MRTLTSILAGALALAALILASTASSSAAMTPSDAVAASAFATQTVTYTCTAATGEIQSKDARGNWVTFIKVTEGHVFVTDTDQEGNFRFLPEDGWTRKVG